MYMLTPVAFGLSLLGAASALPTSSNTEAHPNPVTWTVKYDAGCGTSPAGCAYGFNITAPATRRAPAIDTTCYGANIETSPIWCNDHSVYSLEHVGKDDETLQIFHRYTHKGVEYTDSGVYTFPDGKGFSNKYHFSMSPDTTTMIRSWD